MAEYIEKEHAVDAVLDVYYDTAPTAAQRWMVTTMPKPTVPVIVTDPDGKEHRFTSVTAAAKYIGVIPPRVSTACTLGIRLHGYRVRYENGVGQ